MRPVILSDLDDTLFQTGAKCPAGTEGLRVMSVLSDGTPSGFATAAQEIMLAWMTLGQLIPVTARSTAVLARVDIPQATAICSNGGCILREDGSADPVWHDLILEQSREGDAVADVYGSLAASLHGSTFRHWMVLENGLPLYITIKSNAGRPDELADLARRQCGLIPASWRRHDNGNVLAYLPGWLNKRHAAGYLIEKLRALEPQRPIVGIGDSLSDAGFMDLCDYAMAPTQSQLWRAAVEKNGWLS